MYTTKQSIIIISTFILLQSRIFSHQDSTKYIIGEYKSIQSNILNEERKLIIHLPANYPSSEEKFPVLYLLEGDWTFLIATALAHVLSEDNRVPKMIIIGILNTDRLRDFLPTHVDQVPSSGGSDNFIRFMNEELIPFIDKKYRTKPSRILFGASNSGLYVIYHLLKSPNSFDNYIAASPTVRHDDFFINKLTKDTFPNQEFDRKYLYITYGEQEGDWMISPIQDYEKILKTKVSNEMIWKVQAFENEGHVPPTSLYEGLKFIYKSKQ